MSIGLEWQVAVGLRPVSEQELESLEIKSVKFVVTLLLVKIHGTWLHYYLKENVFNYVHNGSLKILKCIKPIKRF